MKNVRTWADQFSKKCDIWYMDEFEKKIGCIDEYQNKSFGTRMGFELNTKFWYHGHYLVKDSF